MGTEQLLKIDPGHELKFKGPFNLANTSYLRLDNPTNHKICFRIKLTAQKQYIVRPNHGVIESGGHLNIPVILLPCEVDSFVKKHFFMVQAIVAPNGEANNQEEFWKNIHPSNVMGTILKCKFEVPPNVTNSHQPIIVPEENVVRSAKHETTAKPLKMDDGGGLICPTKRKSSGEDPEHAVSREIKKCTMSPLIRKSRKEITKEGNKSLTPPIIQQHDEMEVDETHGISQPNQSLPIDGSSVGSSNMEDDEKGVAQSEATIQFPVKITDLSKRTLSLPIHVRHLAWRIVVKPYWTKSNTKGSRKKWLSFFLQCNNMDGTALDRDTWTYCNAVATLRLRAQQPGCEDFIKKISPMFKPYTNYSGYDKFIAWDTLLKKKKGYVKDDTIVLEVDVKADPPHGGLWDSKKLTGYVGLQNEGATCYMNSLLQVLYFIKPIRNAVYQMPTESDDSTKSVALALRCVFRKLESSDKPVGTKELTRALGWKTKHLSVQHDAPEFLTQFLDRIESEMKGTRFQRTVPNLFEGKMNSVVKCKNVQFESPTPATYYDIQLDIKGNKDIYQSFKDYVKPELLEDKYDAGEHGFQIVHNCSMCMTRDTQTYPNLL